MKRNVADLAFSGKQGLEVPNVHGGEAAFDGLHIGSVADRRSLAGTLRAFAASAAAALGDDLLALYISGSLTMGDFQSTSSDVDFLAVTRRPLDVGDLPRIIRLHADLAREPFGARLAGSYTAAGHLRPWGIEGDLVSVEPGTQPTFGPSDYSADNMWALRNKALVLVGDPPESVMPDVDEQTVRAGLREYLGELIARIAVVPGEDLSPCLLNIARCMFGIAAGRACTKQEAADWLLTREPDLAPCLLAALHVRSGVGKPQLHEEAMRSGTAKLSTLATAHLAGRG